MKVWHAVSAALLFFIPPAAVAADDLNAAARELARKTAAFGGRDDAVSETWRNVSSLGSSEQAQARNAFEAALKEAGIRASESGAVEARLTLSENQSEYLLVEEIRKGAERQVWIAAWKRTQPAGATPAATLEKKLVWEQDEPMLDVAFAGDAMLVLTRSKLLLFARNGARWEPKGAVAVVASKPWPRDPRARLRVTAPAIQAYLPGTQCSGTLEPTLSFECRASDQPWVLESGSRALLLGSFVAARNYFDGRVTTQTGLGKTLAPFYSVAEVDEQGRQLWLLAMLDGKTQIFDAALDPAGAIGSWGSDIAGVDTQCGGPAVLATRSGDATVPDGVQAFSIVNRAPAALTAAAEFPGPVVALWPSGGTSAVAIVRNLASGRYEAYVLTVNCGS